MAELYEVHEPVFHSLICPVFGYSRKPVSGSLVSLSQEKNGLSLSHHRQLKTTLLNKTWHIEFLSCSDSTLAYIFIFL